MTSLSNILQFINILRIIFNCKNYTVSSHNYSYIISVNYGMMLVYELEHFSFCVLKYFKVKALLSMKVNLFYVLYVQVCN